MSDPWLQEALFSGSWLAFVVAAGLVAGVLRGTGARRWGRGIALLAVLGFVYARFVEPGTLVVKRTVLELDGCFAEGGTAQIALIADLHAGVFRNAVSPRRVAARLAELDVDAVLIAGDFVYELAPERFGATFAPLGELPMPVYFVLGNHDVGLPGPDVGAPLREALVGLGLVDIEDRVVSLATATGTIALAGLSEQWLGRQRLEILEPSSAVPRIGLSHHPESIENLPDGADMDLLLAGHTHGGQVYIPGVTCQVVGFACLVVLEGEFRRPKGRGYVTAGIGMVGLPVRLGVPPRIDRLEVRYAACGDR